MADIKVQRYIPHNFNVVRDDKIGDGKEPAETPPTETTIISTEAEPSEIKHRKIVLINDNEYRQLLGSLDNKFGDDKVRLVRVGADVHPKAESINLDFPNEVMLLTVNDHAYLITEGEVFITNSNGATIDKARIAESGTVEEITGVRARIEKERPGTPE